MTWEETLEKMGIHFGVTFAVMAAVEATQQHLRDNTFSGVEFTKKYGEDAAHIISIIEIPK